jgi:hypothetical protein
MNTAQTDIFDALNETRSDPAAMLDRIVQHLRESRQPMELFEALKMRTRHQLGLSLLPSAEAPACPEDVERQLEAGLLDACRETGTMLISAGKVGEGWMYLRPTGDVELGKQLIAEVAIDDDNYDEMIQVLLHEGVDVGRGYQAVLDRQGTCNSITIFEQALAQRSKSDQRQAAACLLDHLYQELSESVRGDILRREAPAGDDESLIDMIERRPWLLAEGGYHVDTTHLQSTVRIASVLEQPEQWNKAWELTQYGKRLNHQLQYPGDEPFVDFYPAYATFYASLLGNDVDAGLKQFERKAKSVDALQHGTGAIEIYVELLDRVGRHAEAVAAAIELMPDEVPAQRVVPLLIEIAGRDQSAGGKETLAAIAAYCRRRGDVLGCAAALHAAESRL